MEKILKTQKKLVLIYIMSVLACIIYALGFMTQYSNLFGFENPLNEEVINFHSGLQIFNNVIFVGALVGAISIILIYALELKKCICDFFACIVSCIAAGIILVTSIIGFCWLPGIISQYQKVDFSFMGLEDLTFEGVDYVRNFSTFYIGIVLYAFVIIAMISFIVLMIKGYKKSRKIQMEGELNEKTE